MRLVRAVHDVALALLAGGIAGVGLCVSVLFDRAPSREIAGRIGSAIFGRIGPAVLLLAVIVFGARLMMRTERPSAAGRAAALIGSALMLVLAAANALWLTPRMTALWAAGAHAADGSGLVGEDRHRFLVLHGAGNLAYLSILFVSLVVMILSVVDRAER